MVETFNFTYGQYGRQTLFPAKSFAIEQANNTGLKSKFYAGYMGIGPYTANLEDKRLSFLWQLKDSGFVDHIVVSIYMKNYQESIIKFGSYDKNALADPDEMVVFQTPTSYAWSLRVTDI